MGSRLLDANPLDYCGVNELVYARFLVTHLNDPLSTLQQMVNAAKSGSVIVVEDLDHAAVFSYPVCPAIAQSSRLYDRLERMSEDDPEIGPSCRRSFVKQGY